MGFGYALRPSPPFGLDWVGAAAHLAINRASVKICLERRKIPITFAETVIVSTPERSLNESQMFVDGDALDHTPSKQRHRFVRAENAVQHCATRQRLNWDSRHFSMTAASGPLQIPSKTFTAYRNYPG
jgi:hypothetical protein